jgi:hypothetical protein
VKQLIFILLLPVSLFGQYNLVPNPSFEICSNCAESYLEFTQPNGPNIPGWNNPNSGSPDFGINTNQYFPFNQIDGPNILGGVIYQSTYNEPGTQFHDQREYIQCELIDSLIFKKLYKVEFYTLSFLNLGNFLTNNLGVHFSDNALSSNNTNYFNLNSQVKYFNNEIIQNPQIWEKFTGIYEATGGEEYMTVGNFNSDIETNFICLTPWWPASGGCYVYYDKFSVTPLDSIPDGLQVNAGNDQSICIGDTVFIGEKISNLPANWYLLDGTVVENGTAGIYVHPAVTTTYVVTMTINGVYSTDTVTVTVGCAGVDEPEKPKFSIGPNPNNGQFAINGQLSEGDIISIISPDGIIIKRINVREQAEKLYINVDLSPGIYLLQISTREGDFCEKIRLE